MKENFILKIYASSYRLEKGWEWGWGGGVGAIPVFTTFLHDAFHLSNNTISVKSLRLRL